MSLCDPAGKARRIRDAAFVVFVSCAVSLASAQNGGGKSSSETNGASPDSHAELPDSPSATHAQLQGPERAQDSNAQQASPPAASASGSQQAPESGATQTLQNSQAAPQKPVGTAAAEPTRSTGIAASQPAGAAIASGKQRRVRTIAIAVGAIVGAGVAIGTVAALSAGTSSRPPGAH